MRDTPYDAPPATRELGIADFLRKSRRKREQREKNRESKRDEEEARALHDAIAQRKPW